MVLLLKYLYSLHYWDAPNTIDFLGLPLITGTVNEIVGWLIAQINCSHQSPIIVTHINANNYYILSNNPRLCRNLERNGYLLFDGIAMKLAATGLGLGWIPDLNGTDLFPLVMTKLVEQKVPLYLVGGSELVIEKTVQQLRSFWTEINIVGYTPGYFNETEEDQVVQSINASGAKVLLVGRGFPIQEEFSLRQRTKLKVSLIWNVGGLFDFLSGNKPRAPLWLRRMRLEWLFRLALEPHRLWARTFIVGPWLLSHIFVQQQNSLIGVSKKKEV